MTIKMQKAWIIHLSSLLAVALYAWLVQHYYGWQNLIATWQSVSFTQLASSIALLFFTYAVRATRIYYYFSPARNYPLASCIKIMLVHNLLNNLLPMRTGEASFPFLMRKEFGTALSTATALLVMLRILDLQILLVIGGLSFLLFTQQHGIWIGLLPIIAVFPLVLFPFTRKIKNYWARFQHTKIHPYIEPVLDIVPARFAIFLRMWLLSWLSWGIKIAVFTFIMLRFTQADTHSVMIATFAGELSAVIPIHTPGGLGTYEAGMVGISALLGLQAEWILFAGVQLHILIIFSTLLAGVLGYLIPSRHAI
jgi:uncharacterized membrane protein YbhN (UPF0104 family)